MFALVLWFMPSTGSPEPASPTACTLVAMLFAMLGVPVGIVRIRRGER